MKKFKIVEEAVAYKEYWIEAKDFEDAKMKWEANDSDVDDASYYANWDVLDMIDLNSIEDEEGHVEYYN